MIESTTTTSTITGHSSSILNSKLVNLKLINMYNNTHVACVHSTFAPKPTVIQPALIPYNANTETQMTVIITTSKCIVVHRIVYYTILCTTIDSVIIDHVCIYSSSTVLDRAGCDHHRTWFSVNEKMCHQ